MRSKIVVYMGSIWKVLLGAMVLVSVAAGVDMPQLSIGSLTANPENLAADGNSISTITAVVSGVDVGNKVVYFEKTSGGGSLSTANGIDNTNGKLWNRTDSNGMAYATLQAPNTANGPTVIRASLQTGSSSKQVTVTYTSTDISTDHPRYDINGDRTIDILDLATVGQHFGESTVPPYPAYDINEDGTIDILDLATVGQHFGETY